MALPRAARIFLLAAATLVLATVFWAVLSFLAAQFLGSVYGWSRLLPMPHAPQEVFIGLFLVVLPVLSLTVAWLLVRRACRPVQRRSA